MSNCLSSKYVCIILLLNLKLYIFLNKNLFVFVLYIFNIHFCIYLYCSFAIGMVSKSNKATLRITFYNQELVTRYALTDVQTIYNK